MTNEVNFDKFRKVYEAEEHWILRKAFLKAHWNHFSEDQLHCLAQVFVNMELLGCKYPLETMSKVSQLANQVQEIRRYRESRKFNLKRTFVGAQDAVQAKLQKIDAPRKLGTTSPTATSTERQPSSSPAGSLLKLSPTQQKSALRRLLQDVIYFEQPDNDVNGSLNKTISLMQKQGRFEQSYDKDQNKFFYIFNGQIISEGEGESKKAAKKVADENFIETLKSNCYTIRSKALFYSPDRVVTKATTTNEPSGSSNSTPVERDDKIQENNLGFKMLKMLGWKGGALGAKCDGIVDPVTCEIKIGRGGLGASDGNFDANYFKDLLRNFKAQQLEYDLVFSAEFNKEERARLHQFASQLNMRTKSYGKVEGSRHIVISAKLSPQELKWKLLEGDKNLLEKYDIIAPKDA